MRGGGRPEGRFPWPSSVARLVLRTDIATIDGKAPAPVQRHEDARAQDISLTAEQRPLLEGVHCQLELSKPSRPRRGIRLDGTPPPPMDDNRQGNSRRPRFPRRLGIAGEAPQTVAVAIGPVDRDLDPLPALGDKCRGFRFKLLGDRPVEKGRGQGSQLQALPCDPRTGEKGCCDFSSPDPSRAGYEGRGVGLVDAERRAARSPPATRPPSRDPRRHPLRCKE